MKNDPKMLEKAREYRKAYYAKTKLTTHVEEAN